MKLRILLPIQASASFEVDLPDEWNDMDVEEQAQFVLDYAETEVFLCEECAEKMQSEFENLRDDAYDLVVSKLEEQEFEIYS
jgi:hypothetical protein